MISMKRNARALMAGAETIVRLPSVIMTVDMVSVKVINVLVIMVGKELDVID